MMKAMKRLLSTNVLDAPSLPRFRYILSSLVAVAGLLFLSLAQPATVFADTPAVTDFGQDTPMSTWTAGSNDWGPAVFLTLHADGSGDSQVRLVHDDAQNTFLGEHPGWHLDHRLTWFVQMPVYVRDLSGQDCQLASEADAV